MSILRNRAWARWSMPRPFLSLVPKEHALFGGARPANELKALQALAASIDSEAALAERLKAGGVAEAIAKAMFAGLRQLGEASAVTGQQLHGKFVQVRSRPQCVA